MRTYPAAPVAVALIALCLLLSLLAASCGSGSTDAARAGVTIEALRPTPLPAAVTPVGGKPAPPAVAAPVATETPDTGEAPTAEIAAPSVADVPTPVTAGTAAAAPRLTLDGSTAPAEGRWIDVNVTTFVVRLMDGATVTREIASVAVGAEVDTGNYASTQTGLFHVNRKAEELTYDPPYDTYISHWVGFDPDKANGFHSYLKDKDGKVIDPGSGRISNGCIRTGSPEAVFAFAEIGMPVWVHH